jgi:hypothetical protein
LEHTKKGFYPGFGLPPNIFNHTNEINLSIQSPEIIIRNATEELQAFLTKLSTWKILADFQIPEEVLRQDGVGI